MANIVLTTLNSRYIHASLGLRYLLANLGEYRAAAVLHEFTIKRPVEEIIATLLKEVPRIIGFGVYIWNTEQTCEVVRQLRILRPEIIIVVGGPEISYETETQELFTLVDFVFKGEADVSFYEFIRTYFSEGRLPSAKILAAPLPDLTKIKLPYGEYSAEDLRTRVVYVEASRGCPYKCEYCLSSLDVSVRNFASKDFFAAIDGLIERGAKQFKFVDRTFNLAPQISTRILEFFLSRVEHGIFLHFEMVPDRLPDELKILIEKFPAGSLQFEIGIQTWNPQVARLVSRRQNYVSIAENLKYLREKTGVHTHADLIVGLPGESLASFANGFNALYALGPDEIQVGLLKRLKGTPIVRHDIPFQMIYEAKPPFTIVSTKDLSADEVHSLKIFADFWDTIFNSGKFPRIRELTPVDEPFTFHFELSKWMFEYFGRTHSIHLLELTDALREYLRLKALGPEFAESRVNQARTTVPARQARHLNV